VNAAPNRLTAKFVKSLKKQSDDSDETPKGGPDGGSVQEPLAIASGQAEPPLTEPAEIPIPERKAADVEHATPVELTAYADLDPDMEFMLAVRAKIGDRKAFEKLWKKYCPVMTGMFRFCRNLTKEERASEAALVFVRKLELFCPEKIGQVPKDWTFSYMLTGGVKNARDKIIRHSIKDVDHDLDFDEETLYTDTMNQNFAIVGKTLSTMIEVNKFEYEEKYNPELYAMRTADVSLEEKEKALMTKLSPVQRTILQLRQAGKTLKEIADEMGCGFAKVRMSIIKAREVASSVFDIEYS
jgi:DNA-directed RNA polymerase specialized sigma24 family protein